MLAIDIPGFGVVRLRYLVLDLNGTLTNQGVLIRGVKEQLQTLQKDLEISITTANTFGEAQKIAADLGVSLKILHANSSEREQKARYVEELGPEKVVAIGNGNNDVEMLKKARIGIVVIGPEGAANLAILNATIVVHSINDALQMLLNPQVLKATLRY